MRAGHGGSNVPTHERYQRVITGIRVAPISVCSGRLADLAGGCVGDEQVAVRGGSAEDGAGGLAPFAGAERA